MSEFPSRLLEKLPPNELVKSWTENESETQVQGVKSPLLSLAVLINIYDPCTISILSHKNADEKNLDEAGRGI